MYSCFAVRGEKVATYLNKTIFRIVRQSRLQASYEHQAESTLREETHEIATSSILPPKYLVRRDFGDLSELKESIINNGLLHPIVVRKTADPSQFQLVCGNRRLEAFKQLGLKKIPALVRELNEKSSFEIFLTENIQRQTLSPLEEARAFYSYTGPRERKCFGYGKISELAQKIGKSQEYISNRIRLLKLPEWLLEDLMSKRDFPVSHAEELASLASEPAVLREFSQLLMEEKVTVRVMERAIPLVKSGVDVKQAIEFAKIETDLKVDWKYRSSSDHKENLFRRSKKVLESSLSYLDTVMENFGHDEDELEENQALRQLWITSVRLKIHQAIDGVINCEKIYRQGRRRSSD